MSNKPKPDIKNPAPLNNPVVTPGGTFTPQNVPNPKAPPPQQPANPPKTKTR